MLPSHTALFRKGKLYYSILHQLDENEEGGFTTLHILNFNSSDVVYFSWKAIKSEPHHCALNRDDDPKFFSTDPAELKKKSDPDPLKKVPDPDPHPWHQISMSC